MSWTLQIEYLGRVWEWQGIQASLTERMQAFSDSPTFRSVSVAVIFAGVNVSQEYARGHRLEGSTARLLLDGAVHLVGLVDTPIFAGMDAPVRLSVREVPSDESGIFPGQGEYLQTSKDVDASREASEAAAQRIWDSLPGYLFGTPEINPLTVDVTVLTTRSIGAVYPFLFGAAGDCNDGTAEHVNILPAVPVQVIDSTQNNEIVLLSGHPIESTSVAIWASQDNDTISARVSLPVTQQQDLTGRTISVCNLGGNSTLLGSGGSYTAERDLFATYETAATPAGAADVLETVLSHSTVRIDWQRLRGLRAWLQRYQLAGCIDEQVKPWQWVQSNVVPLLSAAVVQGRNGLYLAPYRPDAAAVAELTDGLEISLDQEIRISSESICNQFTLHYARSEWSRKHARVSAADSTNSAYAAISQQSYRQLHAESQKTDIVYDSATADLITQEQVRARCFASRILTGTMRRSQWSHLRAGDAVTISSSTLGLVSADAVIVALTIDGGALLGVELAMIEDPIRDRYNS